MAKRHKETRRAGRREAESFGHERHRKLDWHRLLEVRFLVGISLAALSAELAGIGAADTTWLGERVSAAILILAVFIIQGPSAQRLRAWLLSQEGSRATDILDPAAMIALLAGAIVFIMPATVFLPLVVCALLGVARLIIDRRRRSLATLVLLGLLVNMTWFVVGAGAWLIKHHDADHHRTPAGRPNQGRHRDGTMPARHRRKRSTAGGTQTWSEVCPTLPGADGPKWAAGALFGLYLDPTTGEAPGAAAGCTGPVLTADAGRLVYVIGRDPISGDPLSVAVDSRRFGPALFLSPANGVVLKLIQTFGVVGGWPRFRVGNGDAYIIRTADGPVALVRYQLVLTSDPTSAEPYTALSPGVTFAWIDAMTRLHRWLWPVSIRGSAGRFRLVDSPITMRRVGGIVLRSDGRVLLELGAGRFLESGAAQGVDLNALRALAASATGA